MSFIEIANTAFKTFCSKSRNVNVMSQTYHLKQNKTKLMLGLIYSLQNIFSCILSIID